MFVLPGGLVRVTSKGQVTIPIEIREQVGIEPGVSEVEFSVVGKVVQLRKVASSTGKGRAVLERLMAAAYDGPSTDALMALTRKEA
jgi:AbrB family looped-hinge helix DNA binding protein